MKQQYIKLFSFLLGLSFIVSGVIFTYVKAYKDDKKEQMLNESKITDEIGDVYKTFYTKEKELRSFRNKLVKEMSNYFTYYTEMPSGYKAIIAKVKEYETKIKEAEDISSYLSEKCKSRYSVKAANENCYSYYRFLEESINVFVGDIEFFNSKIDEYNKWIKVENKSLIATVQYKALKKYVSEKYTEYVDLNKDGTELGNNSD